MTQSRAANPSHPAGKSAPALDAAQIEVLAPNLKRRLSGVTATIVRLVPFQASGIGIVATGWGLPPHVPHIGLWRALLLPRRRRQGSPWRVWHARRNVEMALGLILRHAFGKRLKLLFTSASQRVHQPFTRFLIGHMDAVVATSSKTATYLHGPATVIRHGIDVQSFAPAADRARIRAELGLPAGLLIGCFGRIRHQKGTDVFIDALLALMDDHPEVHGVILGLATEAHARFERALRARVNASNHAGRIHFMGEVPVDAMPRWYQALDIFVAPQRWEGFGLTPLEAMACAVPVVATTVGAFGELVKDGETGILVPPGDSRAIAESLRGIIEDAERRQRLGRNARAHVCRQFRIEDEAKALNALYRSLLDG
ncbi:MAG: glycosyltransferase family 1 protein [Alphaproteobacteria bacterium]|nr:glycosyltransferase family 1 protein [Alphaproteobacteria bacterium]